jgi:hypothetical protein
MLKEAVMFRSLVRPAVVGRPGWIALGLVVGALVGGSVHGAQAAAPAQAEPAKNPFAFGADGALVLNYIKPDKVADFEMVVGKIKEALAKSENAQRKAQAAGWKIFKAAEPGPNGAVLYVWIVDPVAKGTEYSVSQILTEGFPTEAAALYKTLADSYSGQAIINLTVTADF